MRETKIIMGMPVTVEIVGRGTAGTPAAGAMPNETDLAAIFDYFTAIDERFSTYKPASEISRINRGEIDERDWSDDMRIIFMLAEETKQRTGGFFDIKKPGGGAGASPGATAGSNRRDFYDPSGIVKGWAIFQSAKLIESRGFANFYVDAGGDIQTGGVNLDASGGRSEKKPWSVGIKNPLKNPSAGQPDEVVKIIYAAGDAEKSGLGIATSGTYIRGEHIYNPKTGVPPDETNGKILSLTVIGPNVYEADRFATAAFAMGRDGIQFIESLPGFEGYMIDADGIATMTTGFEKYIKE